MVTFTYPSGWTVQRMVTTSDEAASHLKSTRLLMKALASTGRPSDMALVEAYRDLSDRLLDAYSVLRHDEQALALAAAGLNNPGESS